MSNFLSICMGGRYHQKYMNFKRFRQEIDNSSVHYEIAQTIKKRNSQSTNPGTTEFHILAGHITIYSTFYYISILYLSILYFSTFSLPSSSSLSSSSSSSLDMLVSCILLVCSLNSFSSKKECRHFLEPLKHVQFAVSSRSTGGNQMSISPVGVTGAGGFWTIAGASITSKDQISEAHINPSRRSFSSVN